MKFFDGLINQLFPDREHTSVHEKETLIREPVRHTEAFLSGYSAWVSSKEKEALFSEVYCNYLKRIAGSNELINFYLHHTPQSNGFYFRFDEGKSVKEYYFMVYYFIERLKILEYHKNNSIREVVEERDAVYITESFYMKPKLKFKRQLPYVQLFGNVTIEHRLKNGKTELIKVMVNSYDDHHYKPAFDFEDLMTELFVK